MAALHRVQLTCDVSKCPTRYPPVEPIQTSVTDLRKAAGGAGWEVMKGKHGRDACPRCRIQEINRAANLPAETEEG